MTETITDRPAGALPAGYRVTATRVHAGQDAYLALECPYESSKAVTALRGCDANLLAGLRRPLADLELGTLVMAALVHDERHTGTPPDQAGEQLREHLDALGEYRLYPDMDVHPFMILNCPYLKRTEARRCPDTVDGECVANLLPEKKSLHGVELAELLRLAAEHEDARTRWLAEAFGTGAYAQLVGRINALRLDLVKRQQTELYIRETADGPSAGIASARADLIGQLLADLDKAVTGA